MGGINQGYSNNAQAGLVGAELTNLMLFLEKDWKAQAVPRTAGEVIPYSLIASPGVFIGGSPCQGLQIRQRLPNTPTTSVFNTVTYNTTCNPATFDLSAAPILLPQMNPACNSAATNAHFTRTFAPNAGPNTVTNYPLVPVGVATAVCFQLVPTVANPTDLVVNVGYLYRAGRKYALDNTRQLILPVAAFVNLTPGIEYLKGYCNPNNTLCVNGF
jgi:hypothetical protein